MATTQQVHSHRTVFKSRRTGSTQTQHTALRCCCHSTELITVIIESSRHLQVHPAVDEWLLAGGPSTGRHDNAVGQRPCTGEL